LKVQGFISPFPSTTRSPLARKTNLHGIVSRMHLLSAFVVLGFTGLAGAQVNLKTVNPGNYSYVSCWSDSGSPRTLFNQYGGPGGTSNVTVENCVNGCYGMGYSYAGLEYSQQCYCDNTLASGSSSLPQSSCSSNCTGNTTEICGGKRYSPSLRHASTANLISKVVTPSVCTIRVPLQPQTLRCLALVHRRRG